MRRNIYLRDFFKKIFYLFGGFTLIELLMITLIITILGFMIISTIFNNREYAEKRAENLTIEWANKNNIEIERISCIRNNYTDVYASCMIITNTNKKIYLKCPCNWRDTNKLCKDFGSNLQLE
jgi:competence protein ComGC